jgi:plastocyanin
MRRPQVVGVATAVVAWLGMGGVAFAGGIQGQLKQDKVDPEVTVVYVDEVPHDATAVAAHPTKVALSQKGARFTPALLPIVVGTDVDMTNDDWIDHSVYSLSLTKVFDLGLYKGSERRQVNFDKPGVVEIGCYIHKSMSATILVLKNPFFTRPKADGSFALDGLPAGNFVLKVFVRGQPERSAQVQVAKDGVAKVDL